MFKNTLSALLLSAFIFSFSACALGPDYERPVFDMPEPGELADTSIYSQPAWWRAFNDPTLNQLMEEALFNNRNLVVAMGRVEEAAAAAGVAFADRLPQIGVGFSGTRQQITSAQAASYGPDASRLQNSWQGIGLFSFEIDIWGKYRRLDEAARAELLSTEAAFDTVMLTLTAEVASTYFQTLSLKAQCQIADNMVKTYQETERIFKARLEAGLVNEMELRRVEGELATNQATLHLLQNQLTQAESALSVLLGRGPKAIIENESNTGLDLDKITLPPEVPEAVPSDLLLRRPDVRMSEGTLIAANARIGAARAAFFPSISLTGSAGYISDELDRLFMGPNSIWSFVGNLSQPIFQGGRLLAQEAMAQARYKQMFATYELTVQNAFRDVRDSLENNRQRRIIAGYRLAQMNAMERSLDLANKQYEQGTIGLMDLLDVRRQLLSAQLEVAESRQMQLSAVVMLCKSLGGGWLEDKGFGHIPGQPEETSQNTTETQASGTPQPRQP